MMIVEGSEATNRGRRSAALSVALIYIFNNTRTLFMPVINQLLPYLWRLCAPAAARRPAQRLVRVNILVGVMLPCVPRVSSRLVALSAVREVREPDATRHDTTLGALGVGSHLSLSGFVRDR